MGSVTKQFLFVCHRLRFFLKEGKWNDKKTGKAASAILIERHILFIRGEKVMLDADLATLMKLKPGC